MGMDDVDVMVFNRTDQPATGPCCVTQVSIAKLDQLDPSFLELRFEVSNRLAIRDQGPLPPCGHDTQMSQNHDLPATQGQIRQDMEDLGPGH